MIGRRVFLIFLGLLASTSVRGNFAIFQVNRNVTQSAGLNVVTSAQSGQSSGLQVVTSAQTGQSSGLSVVTSAQ